MNFSETLGSLGVTILLVAFLLNLLNLIKTEGIVYPFLNFCGAGMACYASWLIPFFPFVVLEGTWTVLSGVAIVKWFIVNR